MSGADRRSRAQRDTALTCGLAAAVAFGAVVVAWSGSPTAADRAPLGPTASVLLVGATTVLLAVALVLAVLAGRVPHRVRAVAAGALTAALGVVGVAAVTSLGAQPGAGLLLCAAVVMGVPLVAQLRRAGVARGDGPADDTGSGDRRTRAR